MMEGVSYESLEKVSLPLVKVAVHGMVNIGSLTGESMRLNFFQDWMRNHLSVQLAAYMIGNEVHKESVSSYKHPENWIEAFKEQYWCFIPRFLQRRFPIKYKHITTTIHHNHLCPHADIPWPKDQHIYFLTNNDPEVHGSSRSLNGDE